MNYQGIYRYGKEKAESLQLDERGKEFFYRCFINTVDTTIQAKEGDTFVITGDIPAMWLRDSSAQVQNYIEVAKTDEETAEMLYGLIQRQFYCIQQDPYANAYNKTPSGDRWAEDIPTPDPLVWEQKYEIDSLCYPIRLLYQYWKETGKTDAFTPLVWEGFDTILNLWTLEQRHEDSTYRFQRFSGPPSDTLTREGQGEPVGYTGMTWSGFRPSDDACQYGYLVPSNMFAVVVLGYLVEIATAFDRPQLAERGATLRDEIDAGIQKHAIYDHPEFGKMYAYEVDGLGNYNLMDDANVPSLLSAPYLGYCSPEDPLYQNTRRFLLSKENPYYYEGTAASGIGSPHTPTDYIWHIALSMQGLTATTKEEARTMGELLLATDGGTGFLHEGFHKDNPVEFIRDWFAWSNTLGAELLLKAFG